MPAPYTHALVVDRRIRQLFASDPGLPAVFRVIGVAGVAGVADNWLVADDDTVSPPPAPLPVAVAEVSSAQAKIWLHRAGRYDAAKAAADADPETAIWFSDARVWTAASPNVAKVGAALGLSPEDIAAAFQAASQILE